MKRPIETTQFLTIADIWWFGPGDHASHSIKIHLGAAISRDRNHGFNPTVPPDTIDFQGIE
jgi:hypothetical protein